MMSAKVRVWSLARDLSLNNCSPDILFQKQQENSCQVFFTFVNCVYNKYIAVPDVRSFIVIK